MKLISFLKGMISQIYIHINDLKPIMPFKINQDVYENHQSGQVSIVFFFIHRVIDEKQWHLLGHM